MENQSREKCVSIANSVEGWSRDDLLSILLVDDDESQCAIIGTILGMVGHQVVKVDKGADAITILNRRSFDIAIIDIVLPDTDGITLLKDLVSRYEDMGVLMLSGHACMRHAMDALNNGAGAFLLKPMDPEDLIAKLDRVAKMKRREKELKASEARYRELFENLGEGVFYSDSRGDIISMNQAGAETLGYRSPAELLGRAEKVWTAIDTGDEYDILRITAYGLNEAVRDIMRFRRRDGSLGWLEMTLRARRNDRGEALGLVGTFNDVSDQLRSQEMLEAIYGLWEDLGEANSLETVGELTLDFLKTMLGIDQGRLSVVEGELIKPVGVCSSSDELETFGNSIASQAVRTGLTQQVPDLNSGVETGSTNILGYPPVQLAVPINMIGGVVGVIQISRSRGSPFSEDDAKLVETISEQVAIVLERLVRSKIGLNQSLSLEDFR
jgi:PAS domain S-box-containing protein